MSGGSEREVRRIEARVHGRYLVEAPGSAPVRAVLVGFHGFGETARHNLEELRRLPALDGWMLVAVEALHPFYTRAGEVVACWMTRQDRELAIEENVAYVRTVLAELGAEVPDGTPIALLGFSQGTAMAYRAAVHGGVSPVAVVALAGDVPPELAEMDDLPFDEVLIGRGAEETWYTREQLDRDVSLLEVRGVRIEVSEFAGGHEWTDEFRHAASRFLRRAAGSGSAARDQS